MMPSTRLMTVGGSDPSGAAGIQRDLATFRAFGLHGCSVITAITAQNLHDFQSSEVLSAETVQAQLQALFASTPAQDPDPAVVKIGMLGSDEIVRAVVSWVDRHQPMLILDPVMRSSTGVPLLSGEGLRTLRAELLSRASLITPNLDEARLLTGMAIGGHADYPAAAARLREMGATRVLLKGGHAATQANLSADFYSGPEAEFWQLSPRSNHDCRGTGCTLASAIAAALARGDAFPDSVIAGKAMINAAIRQSVPGNGNRRLLGHTDWPPVEEDFPYAVVGRDLPGNPIQNPRNIQQAFTSPFYLIVDSAEDVRRFAAAGVRTMQLRNKTLTGGKLLDELRNAIGWAKEYGAMLYINDYWQQAIDLGAAGIHLGQEDLLQADRGRLMAAGLRLGISTHSYFEAAVAKFWDPDYIALGPIFPTTCKSMRFGPQGIPRIGEWKRLLGRPIVAIGGLRLEDGPECLRAGADSVAVISDVLKAADPVRRSHQWLQALAQAPGPSPAADFSGPEVTGIHC